MQETIKETSCTKQNVAVKSSALKQVCLWWCKPCLAEGKNRLKETWLMIHYHKISFSPNGLKLLTVILIKLLSHVILISTELFLFTQCEGGGLSLWVSKVCASFGKYIESSLPFQHRLLFQYMQEQESIMHVHFPMASCSTKGRSNICIP